MTYINKVYFIPIDLYKSTLGKGSWLNLLINTHLMKDIKDQTVFVFIEFPIYIGHLVKQFGEHLLFFVGHPFKDR